MQYVKVTNGEVSQYPFDLRLISTIDPSAQIPVNPSEDWLSVFGIYIVNASAIPTVNDSLSESLSEGVPVNVGGQWFQHWVISPATTAEIKSRMDQFAAGLRDKIQMRLDNFAQTRNYDTILSACTYTTSVVPKFAAEAQCCVNLRDTTWSTCYAMLTEVYAGTRTMPTVAEVMAALPPLVWPA